MSFWDFLDRHMVVSTLVVVLTASGAEADTLRSSFALEGALQVTAE